MKRTLLPAWGRSRLRFGPGSTGMLALCGLLLAALAAGCGSRRPDPDSLINAPGVYTLVNLHADGRKHRLWAVNYQMPQLIPICTPVRILKQNKKVMVFDVIPTSTRYTYYFHKAAGEPFEDHIRRFFGKTCNTERVAKLSPLDQAGVKAGKVYLGMSKQGVIYALGYPPRHKTPSIDAREWRYWRTRFKTISVQFDGDAVTGVKGLRLADVQAPKSLQTAARPPAPSPPAPTRKAAPRRPPRRAPAPRATALIDPGNLYSRKVAVVVGINDYDRWPSLSGARPDAERMASFLRSNGFDEVIEVYDDDANRRKLLKVLGTDLPRIADENSMALIYFAGHGQTETLPGGRKRGYLIPADGDTDDVFSTAISMETLRHLSARTSAKHVYYAIDACYSGLALTRGISVRKIGDANLYLQKMTDSPAVQIITAGSEGEQAVEIGGQGLFTTYLLRALGGEADADGDGAVTASEIGTFVKPSVSRASSNRQTPQFGTIDGGGEVVFVSK